MAKKLSSLPIGAKVKDPGSQYYGKDIIFLKIADNHQGYPSNSTTLLTEKIISIKAFDAREPNNSITQRRGQGNNRYVHSNIRQWLNSSATDWYSKQHSADEPPRKPDAYYNPYDKEKGFMANLTPEFRKAMLLTNLKVIKHPVDGGGIESFTDKIFLPSCTEVGLSNETDYDEGSKFNYFKSDSDRIAYPTQEAVENSDYTNNLTTSNGYEWSLRTPYDRTEFPSHCVLSSFAGNDKATPAFRGSQGLRPALNISSDTLVSDYPDSDGAYRIIFNSPPTISGEDKDLGTKSEPFMIDYTIDDEDGDSVNVQEKINDRTIKTHSVTLGEKQTISLTEENWLKLPNGQNSVKIIATDDGGAEITRKYTFTKEVSKSTVSLKSPLPAEEMVARSVLSVARSIPQGAKFKVEVCNNGYDEVPNWEDVTEQVEAEKKFFFSNKSNTAGKWGYNFRIEIERGTVDKSVPIYIKSIGGNFE